MPSMHSIAQGVYNLAGIATLASLLLDFGAYLGLSWIRSRRPSTWGAFDLHCRAPEPVALEDFACVSTFAAIVASAVDFALTRGNDALGMGMLSFSSIALYAIISFLARLWMGEARIGIEEQLTEQPNPVKCRYDLFVKYHEHSESLAQTFEDSIIDKDGRVAIPDHEADLAEVNLKVKPARLLVQEALKEVDRKDLNMRAMNSAYVCLMLLALVPWFTLSQIVHSK